MIHRRKSYVRIMIIYIMICLFMLFVWWAGNEIYNPKPTPLPTDVIVLPPKATATEVVYPVYTKSPTPVTIATQTNTPGLITATKQVPTYTATHRPPTTTDVPPMITSVSVLPFALENDSIAGRIRWRYYLKDNLSVCAVPQQYRPHHTIIPPTIVPETPPPGVTPKP